MLESMESKKTQFYETINTHILLARMVMDHNSKVLPSCFGKIDILVCSSFKKNTTSCSLLRAFCVPEEVLSFNFSTVATQKRRNPHIFRFF